MIGHVDMDAFFVSVELLLDPSLAGKPVVVGGTGSRGVVAAASYEARTFGIHSAMPTIHAQRLCPHAIFLHGQHTVYHEMSKRVFALLRNYSPFVEEVSVDEAYIDLSGTARLWGPPMTAGERIIRHIRSELGLPASMGIARNKLIAKVGSDFAKPFGLIWIAPGYEAAFLHPLPICRLPGIGPRAATYLSGLGIRSIGDLAQKDERIVRRLGEWALDLQRRARGSGSGSVHPQREQARSISHEVTFEQNQQNPEYLTAALARLTGKVGHRLRRHKLMAWTVCLKLRYDDFSTVCRSHTLTAPTDLDDTIYRIILRLLNQSYQAGRRVRLLGVGVSNLADNGYQRDLFRDGTYDKLKRIDQSVDRIRTKFGADRVMRAAQLPLTAAFASDGKRVRPN